MELTGIAIVVAAAACYAAATVMARLAYRVGADPVIVVGVRFVVGTLTLLAAAAALGRVRRLPVARLRWLAVMGVVSVAVGILFFAAVERLGAGTATLVLYVHPALVAAFAAVFGWERFGWMKGLTLAAGLAGVALVVGTPRGALDGAGVVLGIAAALSLAAYVLLARRAGEGIDPILAGAWVLAIAAVAFIAPAAALDTLDLGQGAEAWRWLLGVGAASGVAFALFLAAVARLGPSRASIGASAEPLLAVVFAAAFVGERLTGSQLLGAFLVVAAVALLPLVERGAVALGDAAPLGRDR